MSADLTNKALRESLSAKEIENQALWAFIHRWVAHEKSCMVHLSFSERSCSCGLRVALEKLKSVAP